MSAGRTALQSLQTPGRNPHRGNTACSTGPIVSRATVQQIGDYPDQFPALFQFLPVRPQSWEKHSTERALADGLHRAMCAARGMDRANDWVSIRPQWHGLRAVATRSINRLVRVMLGYAVEPEHLKTIRRFPIKVRGELYHGLCRNGPRAWQLAESFPALACVLYGKCYHLTDDTTARLPLARDLVRDGAPLSDVAATVELPMALRRIRPQCVTLVSAFFDENPELVAHHLPDTVPKQRAWLRAVTRARKIDNTDSSFGLYVGRHFAELGHWRDVPHLAASLRDWVDAGETARELRKVSPTTQYAD